MKTDRAAKRMRAEAADLRQEWLDLGWTASGTKLVCPRCGAQIPRGCQALLERHHWGRVFLTTREITRQIESIRHALDLLAGHMASRKQALDAARAGGDKAKARELDRALRCNRADRRGLERHLDRMRKDLRYGCHLPERELSLFGCQDEVR